MEIKLDMKALEALFPAGTDARIRLQQCVIEEFVRKNIKGLSNDSWLRNEITTSVSKYRDEVLSEFGKVSAYGMGSTKFTLSQPMKDHIRNEVKNTILKEAEGHLKEWSNSIYEEVNVEVKRFVKQQLNAEVSEEISKFVKDAVNRAVGNMKVL